MMRMMLIQADQIQGLPYHVTWCHGRCDCDVTLAAVYAKALFDRSANGFSELFFNGTSARRSGHPLPFRPQQQSPRRLSSTSRTARRLQKNPALASTPWPLVNCTKCVLCNVFLVFV